MRLAFLCGAGLSIPVGMPSTREITEKILRGDGVARHTNSNYYFGNPRYSHMGIGDEYVPKVCGYLAILKMNAMASINLMEMRKSNVKNGSYSVSTKQITRIYTM